MAARQDKISEEFIAQFAKIVAPAFSDLESWECAELFWALQESDAVKESTTLAKIARMMEDIVVQDLKGELPEFIDALGREIHPGSLIAYCQPDSYELAIAEVKCLSKFFPYIRLSASDHDLSEIEDFVPSQVLIVEKDRQDWLAHLLKK
jgi:hypothetical protein